MRLRFRIWMGREGAVRKNSWGNASRGKGVNFEEMTKCWYSWAQSSRIFELFLNGVQKHVS
jgi:hypothetical protein